MLLSKRGIMPLDASFMGNLYTQPVSQAVSGPGSD